MATMKAAIYTDKAKAEVREIPIPELGPTDVLVKTVRSSICGSDLSGWGPAVGKEFGHETAGYIAALGREVKGFKEGDRVWVHPIYAMPPFLTCQLGGFSEYIKVPDAKKNREIWPLSDDISYDEASLIEPFGVGTRGKNRPGAKPGDNVVVYGAGSIGMFCISSLVAQGIIPVVVDIALSDYKRALLDKIGAVVAPIGEAKFDFLRERFGELPQRQSGTAINVDIVVDCAGVPNIIEEFMQLRKENSRLSVVGISGVPQELSLHYMMSSEMVVMGSSGYNYSDIEEVFANLAAKRTFVSDVITHHYKLEQIQEALDMASKRDEAIKVVIDME